jgi:hypothetical protein
MLIKTILCIVLTTIVFIFIFNPLLKKIFELYRLKKNGIRCFGEITEITEGINEDNKKIYGYTIEYKNYVNKIYKLKLKPFSKAKPILYNKVEVIYNRENSQIASILPLDFLSVFLKLFLLIILLVGIILSILFFEKMKRISDAIWP